MIWELTIVTSHETLEDAIKHVKAVRGSVGSRFRVWSLSTGELYQEGKEDAGHEAP